MSSEKTLVVTGDLLASELSALRAENTRLIALLETHGIDWHLPAPPVPSIPPIQESARLSTDQKIALFRRLSRGRTDIYPVRWESRSTGKSGYTPDCANDRFAKTTNWNGTTDHNVSNVGAALARRPGLCQKPSIKCSECPHRVLLPVTDAVIYGHLAGDHTVGVYPLLEGDGCYFLAVDFDEAEWRDDARAFIQSCQELGVPSTLEISRSGQGAHAWIFFSDRISARDARRLGTTIISYTCTRTRQLKLNSYDRLFPNQDTMPKGGFGNLIALPLQKAPRERGCSVFVDGELQPYPGQWAFLASVQLMPVHDVEPSILRATGGVHPLDISFVDEEDLATPWQREKMTVKKLSSPSPKSQMLVLTERTEHLDAIKAALSGLMETPFVLHGRMTKKQRAAVIAELDTLPPDAPRVLLATGRLVGEGFDHPPLDTLLLAMPISWKGTLQQYAGRLHREHATKTHVRIIDFVDTGHPALRRMWDKRQRGYKAMVYRMGTVEPSE